MSEAMRKKLNRIKTNAEGFKKPGINPHMINNKLFGLSAGMELWEERHSEEAMRIIEESITEIQKISDISISKIDLGLST